jgi:hypothetical protein
MGEQTYVLPEMTWPEAKEALARAELALAPVGSFEQHGPHGAFELDTGRAAGFGKLLAACLRRRNVAGDGVGPAQGTPRGIDGRSIQGLPLPAPGKGF